MFPTNLIIAIRRENGIDEFLRLNGIDLMEMNCGEEKAINDLDFFFYLFLPERNINIKERKLCPFPMSCNNDHNEEIGKRSGIIR